MAVDSSLAPTIRYRGPMQALRFFEPGKVAIVDDHTLMREGIRLFVNSLDGFECVWQAASCREAIGQIEQDLPDLMIVDITLPDRTGLELIKDLAVSHPEVALLVLSAWCLGRLRVTVKSPCNPNPRSLMRPFMPMPFAA